MNATCTDSAHIHRCLEDLYSLTLHGNPLEERKGYRNRVLLTLPHLKSLDFTNVTLADARQLEERRSAIAAAEHRSRENRVKSTFWYHDPVTYEIISEIDNILPRLLEKVEVRKESTTRERRIHRKEPDFWDEFYPRIPIDRDRRRSPWIRGFNRYEEFDRLALFPSFMALDEVD